MLRLLILALLLCFGSTAQSMPGPLAAKVAELKRHCGGKVISAIRPRSKVCNARRCRPSDHALGTAVDMTGDYACMFARLKSWPGGYTTDVHRCRHIHISYNPKSPEWGRRFRHSFC